jgi:energy-coupling factor transporter ATP-binding protein EcfA2
MELTAEREPVIQSAVWLPEPQTVAATGLDLGLIYDLTLKTIYFGGRPSARGICDRICLPFAVMEGILEYLRRQELVEIVGSTGVLEQDYQYSLTSKGMSRTQEALEQSLYVGPAPVPFDLYEEVVARQGIAQLDASPERLARAFEGLVLAEETVEQIGTAVGSGRSLFLYGPPGNGKSTIAEYIVRLLSETVNIPYAIEVFGQIVRVHDPRVHLSADIDMLEPTRSLDSGEGEITAEVDGRDKRWALSRRPLIIGGGEVTLADLELRYSPISKFYVAPLQVKANNGVLVIDDFGRQLVRPEEMLNRWMVPMDRGIDHLVFETGETITIPFDVLLVFATNLAPSQLGDEAFFRRIRHKIRISDPDIGLFKEILQSVANKHGIAYSEATADYLIENYYVKAGRPLRGVHPRDLFDLIRDMAKYRSEAPAFTPEWVDRASRSYFIDD